MSRARWSFILCLLVSASLLSPRAGSANTTLADLDDVFQMDIQQIMKMDVVVTSASKRPQKQHETASAIYVISQDDIRRTGAMSLMEVLRIVPGVQVSRINQNQYAISARGFNRQFNSDKLLVLIDGRSVYRPSSSGVVWVAQDTVLEDIDRIEVIRGPGAALWGSNAVAGVINIITKSAAETQGALLSAGGGTEEQGFGVARYGGNVGNDFSYRVFSKVRNRDDGKRANGQDAFDDKQMVRGGFRTDWDITPGDHFTFQGDYYEHLAETDDLPQFVSFAPPNLAPFQGTVKYTGANLIARWNHQIDDDSNFKFQAYFDRAGNKSNQPSDNIIDQVDLEFQHDLKIGDRHAVSYGLNYRLTTFDLKSNIALNFPNQDTPLYSFFVHDEITLIPNTWNLILGSKFEHNKFTGWEIQPNIRTVWTPGEGHTFWGAVSRAVRLPNPSETGLSFNASGSLIAGLGGLPLIIRATGNPQVEAEDLLAFEGGYRFSMSDQFSFDLAGFFNRYDNLIELTTGTAFLETTPGPPHLVNPLVFQNNLEAEVYGFEATAQWRPLDRLLLSGSYSYLEISMHPTNSRVVPSGESAEGEPQHLFNIRSYLELPHNFEFDTMFYYQGEYLTRRLKPFGRVDVRLAWKPDPRFELALVGQNLQASQHREFTDQQEFNSETQRGFYGKATFRF